MLNNLIDIARKYKSNIALHCDGVNYTYKELYNYAFGIKNYLETNKIDRIGIYTDNNFFTYASILGIVLANKTFVPINHKFPKDRLTKIKDNLELEYCFCCYCSFTSVEEIGFKPINIEDVIIEENWVITNFDLDKTSYVLFTSGSTGEPKGIPINYKSLDALLQNIFSSLPMKSEDKVLQTFELSFDVSIACTFMSWYKGASLYLSPLEGIIAVNAFKIVLENEINWVCIAPSAIVYLKKLKLLKDYLLPFVNQTIFTGEALPMDFVKDWKDCASNTVVYNAYGPTENTVWSFVHEITKETEIENGLVPIGKAVNGFNFKLKENELWVSGNQVFHGYILNERKTNEVLVKEDGTTWYKTGDIVKMQASQDLMYVNRLDNQVQINGFRVELGEVEYKIKKQLGIQNCCVLLNKEKNSLVAIIERNNAVVKNEIEFINIILPFYMQPKKYYHLETFPLNSNSKINRKALKSTFI